MGKLPHGFRCCRSTEAGTGSGGDAPRNRKWMGRGVLSFPLLPPACVPPGTTSRGAAGKAETGAAEAPAADCGGRGAERPKPAQPHPSGGAGGASLASDLGGMRAGDLSAPSKFFPFDKAGRVPSTFRGGLRGGGGKKTGGEGESVKEELSFHSNATQTQPGPWHSWKSRRSRKRAMSLH